MTTARKIRALLIASFVVAIMAMTANRLFFKAKEHAEILKQRRDTLISVFNFQIDNPRSVLFIATPEGVITDVDGVVSKWGFTRTQLIGMKIEELRPKSKRIGYALSYKNRMAEGATAEVRFFENETLLGGDGKEYPVSGGVFWHNDRKEFVAIIAPVVTENP